MAGGVFTPDDRYWAASSSLFYWVVETLATKTSRPKLVSDLTVISEAHLGMLVLANYSGAEQEELITLIRGLPEVARQELPLFKGRENFIGYIEELASMLDPAEMGPEAEVTADVVEPGPSENDVTDALAAIIDDLAADAEAHLLAGDARHGVAWSPETEITVRLSCRGDDEIWVFAGSGTLIRFVAASDGDPGDVALVVRALLRGEGVEMFGDRTRDDEGPAVATGYRLGDPPIFAGGLTATEARWTSRIAGPFGAR